AISCDDAVVCTADTCNPASGCAHTAIHGCCYTDGDCSDHDVCNGLETCTPADGKCHDGTALNCDDGNACTSDTCNPTAGCQHTPIRLEEHTSELQSLAYL